MPRSENRVATTAADPLLTAFGRASAVGRGSGRVAPVLADRHRSGLIGAANLGAGDGAVARDRRWLCRRDDIVDWYERFAAGRPASSWSRRPVSATCPAGPLLRIGHDRFLPGLRQLVEVVRRASDGETRLLIQLIDFLTHTASPGARQVSSGASCRSADRHRAALGAARMPPDDEVRACPRRTR